MTRRAAALATACALVAWACTGGDAGSGERPSTVPTPTALDDDTFITAPPLETELVDAADRMTWSTLEMGAGGFVTGGDTDAAGETLLMRTDVGGLYRRDGEVWTQLLHLERVDDPQLGDWQVASAVVAPSDPSRLYAATGNSLRGPEGRILVSDDRGETWSSGAQRFVIDGNAEWRTGGERLAVDPTDPDEVWFGSRTEGLWRSADAGQTFSQVEGVPVGINDGTPAGVLWVIAAPDGATVFAGVAGDGVWQTTDDGASWTRLWETAGLPMDASLGSDGRLWVAERDPGAVRSVMDGVITTHEPQSGRRWEVVEVDPADPDVVLVADDAPDRIRDVGGAEPGGRHLVEQRLEQVVVAAIDQGHVDAGADQVLGRGEPTEAAADDHRLRRGRSGPVEGVDVGSVSGHGSIMNPERGIEPRFSVVETGATPRGCDP